MKTRVYKNNNVTIKNNTNDIAPSAFKDFAEWLCKSLPEAFEAEVKDVYHYVSYVSLTVNGVKWLYAITGDVVDTFNGGKTCRLIPESKVDLFVLPRFYDSRDFEWDGVKGVVYTFCDAVSEDTRAAMQAAGCVMLVSQSQYAPEIRHMAAFIPYGTPFSYC